MVARGAGAAGPVLLVCRQWDPCGLARRLPRPGAGAWRYAPLLPWQVQCPSRVCAALAAGSGGLGPVPGVVSSLFPPDRPAFPALCVAGRPVWVSLILARWYAIPCGLCVPQARSGCPSGFPRVSFVFVCAHPLAASAPPAPPWVGVARAPGVVSVLGAGRAVLLGPSPSACSASVPCSVWLAPGGAARSCFPLAGLGLRTPRGVAAGAETRHQPHRARSCELALRAGFARCGGGLKVPGGGASCLGVGRPGSGALPAPTTRPFGRAAGAHYPVAVGAGGAGMATRQQPHSARSCELALRNASSGNVLGVPIGCQGHF